MCVKGWGEDMADNVDSLTAYMEWIKELRNTLCSFNSKLSALGESECELFFRGLSDNSYQNIPSIFRKNLILKEDVIFNEAISHNHFDFLHDKTTFDKLVRMQHYGVPTRLLDITQDPLVALYFAVKDGDKQRKGKVTAFFISKDKIYYPDSPEVNLLSNLARIPDYDFYSNADPYLEKLVKIANRENPEIEKVTSFDLANVVCVKPRMNNPRIIRQKGAFLLFGQLQIKKFCPAILDWDMFSKIYDVLFICKEFASGKIPITDINTVAALEQRLENISGAMINSWYGLKEKLQTNKEKIIPIGFYIAFLENLFTWASDTIKTQFHELFAIEIATALQRNDICAEEMIYTNSKLMFICDAAHRRGNAGQIAVEINNKESFLQELENYGINDESLFPELDVLGKSLRKKYEHIDERSADA